MQNGAKIVEKYGEIGFGSSKREYYYFEIEMYENGKMIDRKYITDRKQAERTAEYFNQGRYRLVEFGVEVF